MYFDINYATSTVTLDDSGKGELSCKVSNLMKQAVRAQAKVVPEGKTDEKWVTLDAPAKDLNSDGTVTFIQRISVPKGTPADEYRFHLVVSSVDRPEEKFREGPSVAFKVPAPKPIPDGPHFKWWWIVIIAAAVLLVGGAVAFFLWPHPTVHVGDPCPADEKCPEPLACVPREAGKKCLTDTDQACAADGECASDLCLDSKKCAAQVKAGDPCLGAKCTSGLTCVTRGNAKICLVALGGACAAPTDCIMGRCDAGKCSEVAVQTPCRTAADCDGRELCMPTPEGSLCLFRGEQACRSSRDCASRFCRQDRTCSDERGRCQDNRDCNAAEGLSCRDGFCRRAPVMGPMENNVDRMGLDFSNFDLPVNDPRVCRQRCADDARCRAWTFVRPNTIQGPRPRCWLKSAVPPRRPHPCCVSGVKATP